MTSGRWLVAVIVGITAVFAGAMWWFQTRAYYEPVEVGDLFVMSPVGEIYPLEPRGFEGVTTWTSPISYRACFTIGDADREATALAADYEDATPLVAPGWFDCFDAEAIAGDLASGAARAILSEREIHRGVDRVIAIYPDGRAYAWQQLNGTLEQ
ncbi:DUF6446 family protein [Roseibacterium sp. SDUM158017]|uniref:DUF6446 family protein n=1 Tax=Roseicyclus salinarum TaxID=3036773 RepID=UPI0024152592|nr:DUF6446 family protein [Roseibacterium sp. SDUM158017]MDG4647663.1 DUF6446 family protein [Roseibacterium sp. SDUM158017]